MRSDGLMNDKLLDFVSSPGAGVTLVVGGAVITGTTVKASAFAAEIALKLSEVVGDAGALPKATKVVNANMDAATDEATYIHLMNAFVALAGGTRIPAAPGGLYRVRRDRVDAFGIGNVT
jgi:hypothetical protein